MSSEVEPSGDTSALSSTDQARIQKTLDGSRSAATRRIYAGEWAQWAQWATKQRIQPAPADPVFIAAWLTERAEAGASMPTIKVLRSALGAVHRDNGMPDPTASEGIKRLIAGMAQRYTRPPRQACGLTRACLGAIQATAGFPRLLPGGRLENPSHAEARGRLDVALVATMRDGLLHRSEAAAITWDDVQLADDGSGRLTVHRSKTDPNGKEVARCLCRPTMHALAAIRPAKPRPCTLVFGLSGQQICRRIRAAAQAAGLEGDFTSESPRLGMAMDLAAAGCELPALITANRWGSASLMAQYRRSETAARGAVAQYYGIVAD